MSTPLDLAPLVEVNNLSREYKVAKEHLFAPREMRVALAPTNLVIPEGRSLGIIGESGSGKTTLARLILGLDTPTTGEVLIEGRKVDPKASAKASRWLRRETGIVFQDPYASLDPRMTAGQSVAEPLWALGIECDHRARVRETLEEVGLEAEMGTRYPHEFSGGQRQRLAIARAIVHRPALLVGDEPVSALDVSVRAQILELLGELKAASGFTLVLISHDIGVVQHLCEDVAVMHNGEIVEHGASADVLRNPQDPYTQKLLSSVPTIPPEYRRTS